MEDFSRQLSRRPFSYRNQGRVTEAPPDIVIMTLVTKVITKRNEKRSIFYFFVIKNMY